MDFSRYVNEINYDEENTLLYNKYNGALYLIDKEELKELKEIIAKNLKLHGKHIDILSEQKFIVETENEIVYENNSNYFLLTIETTSFCNLDCRYCYEKDKETRKAISDSIINDIYEYVENVFLENEKINLRVGFIGGEPLLEKIKICEMAKRINDICELYKRDVHFHIDTNGSILFKDIYDLIDNLNISISLTLENDHNNNRPGKGFNSFDKIVSNLKMLSKKEGNTISIRYNTNEKNINEFEKFVEFVSNELPIVNFITPMYTDEYEYNNFQNKLDKKKFIKWNSSEGLDILIKYGFKINYYLPGKLGTCIAYKPYSCKIYADGIVTLCDAMYHNRSNLHISELSEKIERLHEYFREYKDYNPTKDTKCKSCENLNLCQGNILCRKNECEFESRYDNKVFACSYVKYFLAGKKDYFCKM